MSMLAEKRIKPKYYLLPRGKPLYEDANNFGTRMLEKMGWNKGKGLGRNEDGSPNFVRVKYKNDNVGIGFEDRDDGWTKHTTDFEGLLKSLHNSKENSDNEDELNKTQGFGFQNEYVIVNEIEDNFQNFNGESLEEKSKKSKARVHYKKFTRAKDLSQYSEKDLANIFGRKEIKTRIAQENVDKEAIKVNENSSKNEIIHCHGVTTICNGTSVQDYFKKKMDHQRKTNNNSTKVEYDTIVNDENCIEVKEINNLKMKNKGKQVNNIVENNEIVIKEDMAEYQMSSGNKKSKENKRKEKTCSKLEDDISVGLISKKRRKKNKLPEEELSVNNFEEIEKLKKKESKNLETHQLNNEGNTALIKNIKEDSSSKKLKKKKEKNSQEDMELEKINKENNNNSKLNENSSSEENCMKNIKRKKSKTNTDNDLEECHMDMEKDIHISNRKRKTSNNEEQLYFFDENKIENNSIKKLKRKNHKTIELLEENVQVNEEENVVENKKYIESDNLKKTIRKKYTTNEKEQLINSEKQNKEEHDLERKNLNSYVKHTDQDDNEIIEKTKRKKNKNKSNEIKELSEKYNTTDYANIFHDADKIEHKSNALTQKEANLDCNIKKSKKKRSKRNIEQQNRRTNEKADKPEKEKVAEGTISSTQDDLTYEISYFSAQQFNHTDIKGFIGSNFHEIIGYGLHKNMLLKVIYTDKDREDVAHMWNKVIDKYKQMEENTSRKPASLNFKRFKKKKAFVKM